MEPLFFINVSRFSLTSDAWRKLIPRQVGTCPSHSTNIKEKGLLVGPNCLYGELFIPRGFYSDFAIGSDFVLNDGNSQPRSSYAVHELLKSEDILRMDWTTNLSDSNAIKHM
ncbi:hypothetical protein TNCV_71381 [Trichonephila clavipes]|nr:hypothetical protein TNCV_71381 [Trichonephila clavipes]